MLDAITATRRVAPTRWSASRLTKSLFFHQTLFLGVTLLVWEVLGAYVFDPFWSSRPSLIAETADRFGAQVLVLSADVRRRRDDEGRPTGDFEVTTHGGRTRTGIDAVAWCARAAELGAGEILLNSMDADGTKEGFDLELIRLVRAEVTVPLIASGGAGRVEHFAPAVRAGADAVLAASVFHFGELSVTDVKAALRSDGHPVR